jgi:peptidylprolyl isomerase
MRLMAFLPMAVVCAALAGCADKAKDEAFSTGLKELKKTDTVEGKGRVAEKGDTVYVLYRGSLLKTGLVFEAPLDDPSANLPYAVPLGQGQVVQGWDEGIVGMKEGGTRILEIPAKMGYGSVGSGEKIPGNADLKFEIQLLFVVKKSDPDVYDFADNTVGTGAEAKDGDTVKIHYVGTYLSGKQWDNSRERGDAVTVKLANGGDLITGLVAGIPGMKVGGKRTLVLPPNLVFGLAGSQHIQGNQPVKVVVELLAVN